MINHFPMWKNFLIVFLFLLGIVYALPTFYKENPIICVTKNVQNNEKIDNTLLESIAHTLKNFSVQSKSIISRSNEIVIYFFNKHDQIYAYRILSNSLFNDQCYLISFKSELTTPYWLSLIKARPIKLGLDIFGGIHLVLRVDTNFMLEKFQQRYLDDIKSNLKDQKIFYTKISKINNCGFEINFSDDIDKDHAFSYLYQRYKDDLFLRVLDNKKLYISLLDTYINKMCEYFVQQNSTILKHRISQLGITDPLIQRFGNDRIIIELPGLQNAEKIKETIGTTASLEFRLVNTEVSEFALNNNLIPENSEIKLTNDGYLIPLYKKVILSGDSIVYSNVSFDEYNRPQVNLTLNKMGSAIISKFTKDNIGKIIATLFIEYKDSGKKDNKGRSILIKHEKIINVATIQSNISDSFRITGINNFDEAHHLSLLLRMGALAAPVYIEEERIIGPMLGQNNIVQGFIACILSIFISILFMVTWYRYFGLIASIALIINFILIISVMSLVPSAILTMSSIAGIVLTLSVAIDSNVLINERIKEERNQGKPMQYAIYVGYRKAFISILDANVTTVITSVILYVFGTEVIKGFAIITIIGVGTSMFTSILGTRLIVNLVYGKKRFKKLSI